MRLYRLGLVALFAFPLVGARIHAQRSLDWNALGEETVRVTREFLRINTTNPPGGELEAARFLKSLLEREGIEATILDEAELGSGRANLYARLKATARGSRDSRASDTVRSAIALVQHLDVVPADSRYWSVDPFSGALKDGYVWGRGALDMKSQGIAHVMAMIAIKRSGLPLERDLVLIANADEELGSRGARVFVRRHADLLRDVEYVITEGGSTPVRDGKVLYYGVGVAEKKTFWHRLTVKGMPGHGSRPTKGNPVPRLIAALDRLSRYETPLHLTPAVERYFKAIAATYVGDERRWMSDPRAALNDARGRAWLVGDPDRNALLRNTISVTVLAGSNKTNVIPAEASAEVDIRLLPDQDPSTVLRQLQAVVDDSAVVWTPLAEPQAPLDNPIDTDLYRAIARVAGERDSGVAVTPLMSTGGTDRPQYRSLGIVTYGFSPFRVDVDDGRRGVHGNDERLSVENVKFGVRLMYDVIRAMQGARAM
jgi:acetylornithine deacetylase/succinyl-diaminopimelate desuccinylase-like protein